MNCSTELRHKKAGCIGKEAKPEWIPKKGLTVTMLWNRNRNFLPSWNRNRTVMHSGSDLYFDSSKKSNQKRDDNFLGNNAVSYIRNRKRNRSWRMRRLDGFLYEAAKNFWFFLQKFKIKIKQSKTESDPFLDLSNGTHFHGVLKWPDGTFNPTLAFIGWWRPDSLWMQIT